MGSLIISKNNLPPLIDEQIKRLDSLKNLSDDEIDYSDIPKITDEEWKRFYKVNPRTPEEWAV